MTTKTTLVCTLLAFWTLLASTRAADTPAKAPTTKETPTKEFPARDQRSPERLQQLIQQLGDKEFYVRERAEAELAEFGFEAFDALSEATASDDLEIAARARHLLRRMKVDWADKSDPSEVKLLLNNYELQSTENRLAKVTSLLALANDVGIPALCRIVRYEKSAQVSKQAAIELMKSQKFQEPPKKEMAELVRKSLAGSRRTAVQWLVTWCSAGDDPRASAEAWAKLIEDEEKMLAASPSQTSPEIVAALLRSHIARLKKLGRTDDAVTAIRRLMQLERGDPETLSSLLQWLIEQKAWKAVDELAERFSPQISANPSLLYALAEAQLAQGEKVRAEQTAAKALALHPGKQRLDMAYHWMMANNLQQRGLFDWAKREYEHIIQNSTPENGNLALDAQALLAEMLHDQGEDLQAADALQAVLDTLKKNRRDDEGLGGRSRSRMNFFLACHWQAKGDQAKHREFLAKALAADETDIDVLIAHYRLPDQKPEERQKHRRLIEKVVADMREQIADDPDKPGAYNQLAWLVANTEGDLDEALQCSRKSLELKPDAGGYYDTLARVYFAKADYENAVKYQLKAAELDPHSGQIVKQLELFRKKLEEKKKAKP